MFVANRAEESNWSAVVAAILYLAAFIALVYAGIAVLRDTSFLEGFLFAFPRAVVVCSSFFAGAAMMEWWQSTTKATERRNRRHAIDSLNA